MNRSFLFGNCVTESIGRPKSEVAVETSRKVDHSANAVGIVACIESLEGLAALHKSDAIVLAVDNNEARIFVNGWAAKLDKPLLDLGTGGIITDGMLRTLGWRASLYVPGRACLECIYLDEREAPQSHVSWLPLNLGAVSAGLDMLVAHLTGYRDFRANHVTYDSLTGELSVMTVSSRDDCPHCGSKTSGTLKEGDAHGK